MGDPRGFLKFPREEARSRSVEERVQDWREVYTPLPEERLKTQAARCMDCGVPFCQSATGCPLHNLIPEWNDLVYRGRWREAHKALHHTNNFPEVTGRVCPAPCESACVSGVHDDPVSIRMVEWNIADKGFDESWVDPIVPPMKTGRKIAIIGSGPAGLAAAQQLARSGHEVAVFEKNARPGGLLRYGIPDFKLEKWVIDRRLEQLKAEGVLFRTGVCVGRDFEAGRLRQEFDAVCLAIGAEDPRDLKIPGRELKGIHLAMEYLSQANRWASGEPFDGEPLTAREKHVVVIGGGDTGSDCVGTAHRQLCKDVHQFEILGIPPRRRDASTPWPIFPMKLRTTHAHEEGCERRWSVSTLGFSGENGQVRRVHAQRVSFAEGKFFPVPGTEFTIEADLVLLAMGFSGPVRGGLVEDLGLTLGPRGTVKVDADFLTSHAGIFAGGDVNRGASLVVWAIAEGRRMADGVERYLRGGGSLRG